MTNFKLLGISEWLVSVLRSFGMIHPTHVQKYSIPRVLNGKNVVCCAQTGCGKTAAFVLPILQSLSLDPFGIFTLVLTPTRELASQIGDQFKAFGHEIHIRVETIIGGSGIMNQAKNLWNRPHVVIATLGRFLQVVTELDIKDTFQRVKFLVLDEADRILDTFDESLKKVLRNLPKTDVGRRTLLYSASMTQSIENLIKITLHDAYIFQSYEELRCTFRRREQYLLLPASLREVYLYCLLEKLEGDKLSSCIVFADTCNTCVELDLLLRKLGLPVTCLHSKKSQKKRILAIEKFKNNKVSILIVTDLASRGLDIPTVDLVINFDMPKLVEDYIHRVGRTARAWRGGFSLSFVTPHEIKILHKIESYIGKQLDINNLPEKVISDNIAKVCKAKIAIKSWINDRINTT